MPIISVVPPSKPVSGEITVPGSKSISNRALLLASLAKGSCKLTGLLHAHDTHVMLDSLSKLGTQFEWEDEGSVLVVHGCDGKFKVGQGYLIFILQVPATSLYLGNAGTATRFLTSMCNLVKGDVTLTGCARLCERPISDLVEALAQNGCEFEFLSKPNHIPFTSLCISPRIDSNDLSKRKRSRRRQDATCCKR